MITGLIIGFLLGGVCGIVIMALWVAAVITNKRRKK